VAPQRPTAAQQRRHQQPAFVHQQQARVDAAGSLFDARPILGQPLGNRLVNLFAVDAPGLLRRVPALPEPGAQVVGVEVGAELLLDELSQARSGPQVGNEAIFGGGVGQPAEHDLLLGRGELGRTPRHRLGRQAITAVAAVDGEPASNAAGIDGEEVGRLLGRVALDHALDGERPAVLQDFRGACASHTGKSCKTRAQRALLT
jgi:hypothetical protein